MNSTLQMGNFQKFNSVFDNHQKILENYESKLAKMFSIVVEKIQMQKRFFEVRTMNFFKTARFFDPKQANSEVY